MPRHMDEQLAEFNQLFDSKIFGEMALAVLAEVLREVILGHL